MPASRFPVRTPLPWGVPLIESDYLTLAESWISRELVDEAMLVRVNTEEGREAVSEKGTRDCAGILIPYYWPGESSTRNYRLRRDNPDWVQGKDGKPKRERKYLGPPASGNWLYIPPSMTLEQLRDVAVPICITEGEKKALALSRLACYQTQIPRFIPLAIAGVWNWRGKIGKVGGPRGESIDLKGPIPDLDRVEWKGRRVSIVFDSNVHSNDSVKWARKGIARELASRGAVVEFVNLPADCNFNGVDELLAAWGPVKVLALFAQPLAGIHCDVILSPQFQSRAAGMFRVVQKGERLTETQLSNYRASIKTNIQFDDGVETRSEFEIESEHLGFTYRFTVAAAKFGNMDWAIEHLGPSAITFPNPREYARTAIQSYSMNAERRSIFTHTGWREIEGRQVFLHASGGIGEFGAVTGVNVHLNGGLSRFELQVPISSEALASAVRKSVLLSELAPPSVSFPMRAATCRSVFGGSDFSIHVVGETGAFKSELAALEQQHFGASMTRLNLPGSWSSTGNAIEAFAFQAKDTLIVVDDFAPQGSAADVGRYHASADRVFRAVGNQAGRSRLDSTARLREVKPPRSLILSTGEDIPRGHSIRARMLIVELSKGDINTDQLSGCQKEAAAGIFAEAMGGFIQWLAGSYADFNESLKKRAGVLRDATTKFFAHGRTPGIIANLQAAFEIYLDFAESCGAINLSERRQLTAQCWDALKLAAGAQAKHQIEAEPVQRFLSLLRSAVSTGQAHLASRSGEMPETSPQACGWNQVSPGIWCRRGDCVGWIDGNDIYLEPTAAFAVAQTISRSSGEPLAVSEQILKKRLREKGFLASTDSKRETLSVRRILAGSNKDVLHLTRSTLLLQLFEEPVESFKEGANVGFPCRAIPDSEAQPDKGSSNNVNHLDRKCRECRVITTAESAGDFSSIDLSNDAEAPKQDRPVRSRVTSGTKVTDGVA